MALPASLFTLALERFLGFFVFSLFRIYSVCALKPFHDDGTFTIFLVLERKFPQTMLY